MNLLGACYILKLAEEGKSVPTHIVELAQKRVTVAQVEFEALKLKLQIKD